jgi:hypothetical protein
MKRLMFLSAVILSASTAICMDTHDANGNLTSFEVCGVSYDRDDNGNWSQSFPDTVTHDDIMQSIDNTISSYESQTDTVTTSTTDDSK